MRQLTDILIEKIQLVGGKAALGRALGDITGQQIFKYTQGTSPSIDFAVKWKEAFGENLIDLMFADDKPSIASEPDVKYSNQALIAELNDCRKELISCMKEKEELKKFLPVGDKPELKKKVLKK